MSDFWVFGYGSLMWRPGFAHVESRPARLVGLHRALCVSSWVHRGTEAEPGLVLGLDRGGSCRGLAFRVAGEERPAVMAYLRERELVTDVYREMTRRVWLANGARSQVDAITYVVNRQHAQYAGNLARDAILARVRHSRGKSGANAEYVINTQRHLETLGIHDPVLTWLAKQLV